MNTRFTHLSKLLQGELKTDDNVDQSEAYSLDLKISEEEALYYVQEGFSGDETKDITNLVNFIMGVDKETISKSCPLWKEILPAWLLSFFIKGKKPCGDTVHNSVRLLTRMLRCLNSGLRDTESTYGKDVTYYPVDQDSPDMVKLEIVKEGRRYYMLGTVRAIKVKQED